MQLTERELSLIKDTDFLITKSKVLRKVTLLLEDTRNHIKQLIAESGFKFPPELNVESGKVSRGENYLLLPYQVLDFPSLFGRTDVFAFRTMFWWGHYFSCTIHLQGKYLDDLKGSIWENREQLIDKDIFICVGSSPWQYHYGADNYLPYSQAQENVLRDSGFLKLSKKVSLEDWDDLPVEASEFLNLMLSIL
jgi:hypothetical protein